MIQNCFLERGCEKRKRPKGDMPILKNVDNLALVRRRVLWVTMVVIDRSAVVEAYFTYMAKVVTKVYLFAIGDKVQNTTKAPGILLEVNAKRMPSSKSLIAVVVDDVKDILL